MTHLKGKVALITGAASGLGLAVARQMAAAGARLVLVDWDQANLQVATGELERAGAEVKSIRGDVSEEATATDATDLAKSAFGAQSGQGASISAASF